jgi:hypothetical protein
MEAIVRGLEASFDAAVGRAEDEAASDLAFSLLQERRLGEVLERRRGVTVISRDGVRVPVEVLGDDFVADAEPSTRLLPLATAVFESSGEGAPPRRLHLDLTAQLRLWARGGAHVRLTTFAGEISGKLVRATPDHVTVLSPGGERDIGREAVLDVRRTRAGREDAV